MTTSGNSRFWVGACAGIAVGTGLVSAVTGSFVVTGVAPWLGAAGFGLVGAAVFVALTWAAFVVAGRLRPVPVYVLCFAVAAAGTISWLRWTRFGFRWDRAIYYPAALVVVAAIAIFVGAFWARGERGRSFGGLVAAAFFALVAGAVWIASPRRDPFPVSIDAGAPPPAAIEAANPATRGGFDVSSFTYGSGTDRHRSEFGTDVGVTSPTVDASKILPEWKGFKARARRWFWGFSIEETPLNGRVWMPAGDGPFPLVLVVHGNHAMEDFSDGGYAYLGELLASRGFITVSVDENFINGTWSGDFRGRELAMRAWLLLEHLKVWHAWNRSPAHRLHGKVDTERIALIGHSRGGEAVSVAYAFNGLDRFPDDATVSFDYGFSIQALVAIAQTDRHYPRRVKLDNVNFLTLQGSYDSDEASSFGMRQFRRIRLDSEPYRFKAGIYIHGANHGQFNTTWGMDSGPPGSWLYNRAALISEQDQREIAKVYIAAFLEATLHGADAYRSLFRDYRAGKAWLPPSIVYLGQFRDSTFLPVADFEEDMDVTTASLSGAVVETENLSVWREEVLRFRDDATQGSHGVVIGSDSDTEGAYAIRFGETRVSVSEDSKLAFFLSSSPERAAGSPIAVAVEIADARGRRASVALEDVLPIAPPLHIRFSKMAWLDRKRFPRDWEATFQSYWIPLDRFSGVDAGSVGEIRFVTRGRGVVILDDVGFSR